MNDQGSCHRLIVSLSALLFVASQANLARILAPLDPGIFAIQFSFTPGAYWHVIDLWGASGLAIYRAHFPYDYPHLLIYGAFGFLLVSRTSLFAGVRPPIYRTALLSLPAASLFDLAENLAQAFLLGQPPGVRSAVIPASATCSSLKWALASVFAALVAVQVARKLWSRRAPAD
jgi:hypothetical protein